MFSIKNSLAMVVSFRKIYSLCVCSNSKEQENSRFPLVPDLGASLQDWLFMLI